MTMTTFTYINYLCLCGNELDTDFERACKEHGIDSDTELDIFPVRSITGRNAYIVSISEPTPVIAQSN